jgi:hypothetical protein
VDSLNDPDMDLHVIHPLFLFLPVYTPVARSMGGGPVTSSSISGPLGTVSATATSIEDRLAILRRTMKAPLPGTAGVHPVRVDDLVVYYDIDPLSSRSVTWSIPKVPGLTSV